jgi:2-keto-3-deoxy-L-rhamnonate aldolase RhmA
MASTDYKYVPAVEHMKRLNDELAIVVHVETREGLQNIEEIVSYPARTSAMWGPLIWQ